MTTPNDDSRRISESVSKALRAAGVPQRTASEQSGIPLTTFVRKITGKSPFNTNELAALARVVDLSLYDLMFYGTDDAPERASA